MSVPLPGSLGAVISCPSCHLNFDAIERAPLLLDCGHTLCDRCFKDRAVVDEDGTSILSCALNCRSSSQHFVCTHLPKNNSVIASINKRKVMLAGVPVDPSVSSCCPVHPSSPQSCCTPAQVARLAATNRLTLRAAIETTHKEISSELESLAAVHQAEISLLGCRECQANASSSSSSSSSSSVAPSQMSLQDHAILEITGRFDELCRRLQERKAALIRTVETTTRTKAQCLREQKRQLTESLSSSYEALFNALELLDNEKDNDTDRKLFSSFNTSLAALTASSKVRQSPFASPTIVFTPGSIDQHISDEGSFKFGSDFWQSDSFSTTPAGADVDAFAFADETGFLLAAEKDDVPAMMEEYVRLGSKVSVGTGRRAMCSAAKHGGVAMIEALYALGVSSQQVRFTDVLDPGSPIRLAVDHGHAAALEALVRLKNHTGSGVLNDDLRLLQHAAHGASLEIVETLVRLVVKPPTWQTSFTFTSAASHQSSLTRFPFASEAHPPELQMVLHIAAAAGRLDVVRALVCRLGLRRDLDATNPQGRTPLFYAAEGGHVAVVEALAELGSGGAGMCDAYGHFPIHAAAEKGHVDVVCALVLRLGVQVDMTDRYEGFTAMHFAAKSGQSGVIGALFRLGASVDRGGNVGSTPMHMAAGNGHCNVIETLVRLGSTAIDTRDTNARVPLDYAAANGQARAIEALVRFGSKGLDSSNARSWTPILIASQYGHTDAIEALMRLGCTSIDTPAVQGMTALGIATMNGNAVVVRLLLALGARDSRALSVPLNDDVVAEIRFRVYFAQSLTQQLLDSITDLNEPIEGLLSTDVLAHDAPNTNKSTAMHLAAQMGSPATIKALGKLGHLAVNTTDKHNLTPFLTAAKHGQPAAIEALVQLDGRVLDAPGAEGWTAMHIAAQRGHVAVIETLIRLGSQAIDAPDSKGHTPMHFAAEAGQNKTLKMLVQLGSRAIDTPNQDGWTPMHIAAKHPDELATTIKKLVRMGSNAISAPNSNNGRTPMHVATEKGNLQSMLTLVQLGSSVDTPDKDGWTPMHVAVERDMEAKVVMLIELGSQAIDTPNSDGRTPMHIAAEQGSASLIESLAKHGSKATIVPDNEGFTPLHVAVLHDREKAIDALLRLDILASTQVDRNGRTPWHIACQVRSPQAKLRLQTEWSSPQDAYGWTALHLTIYCRSGQELIDYIAEPKGNGIDIPDKHGWTCVHIAAEAGQLNVIDALLSQGSRALTMPDHQGRLPWHVAAQNGHVAVSKRLRQLTMAESAAAGASLPDVDEEESQRMKRDDQQRRSDATWTPLRRNKFNRAVHIDALGPRDGDEAEPKPTTEFANWGSGRPWFGLENGPAANGVVKEGWVGTPRGWGLGDGFGDAWGGGGCWGGGDGDGWGATAGTRAGGNQNGWPTDADWRAFGAQQEQGGAAAGWGDLGTQNWGGQRMRPATRARGDPITDALMGTSQQERGNEPPATLALGAQLPAGSWGLETQNWGPPQPQQQKKRERTGFGDWGEGWGAVGETNDGWGARQQQQEDRDLALALAESARVESEAAGNLTQEVTEDPGRDATGDATDEELEAARALFLGELNKAGEAFQTLNTDFRV